MPSRETAAAILSAGGNVRIGTMNADTLEYLAGVAHRRGTKLEIVGSMNAETMVRVSQAGGGAVTWDLTGK